VFDLDQCPNRPCVVLTASRASKGSVVSSGILRAAIQRPSLFREQINIKCTEPLGVAMTTVCPICKSSAQELPRTGDATGFHCPTHGDFKVADTVFAEAKAKSYTPEQWEDALEKAEERTEPDAWPLIITDDFY
jgi:hypothetical protein